jgi:hypothetical protein
MRYLWALEMDDELYMIDGRWRPNLDWRLIAD